MITKFDGQYGYLSNFFHAAIVFNGDMWPTVEHAYQAQKFKDRFIQALVREAPTPGQAKKLGRLHTIRPGWDDIKVPIMRELLRLKFVAGNMLADELIATDPEFLMEGNTWGDTFWGKVEMTTGNWYGENWLGTLLEERRKELTRFV